MAFSKDEVIGFLVLIIVLGGLLWLLSTRPLSTTPPGGATATTTPAVIGPQHITETADLYTVDTQYPGSTPLQDTAGGGADSNAVLVMKSFEENTIDAFKQSFTDLHASDLPRIQQGGYKGSLMITYKAYQEHRTLSYVYTIFEDTLGAHPNTFYRTFVFDTETGGALTLGDLFAPGTNYVAQLSDIARAKLPAILAGREEVDPSQIDTGMLNAGTTADEDNFQNFYLNNGDLVIIFPPYQIAPYAVGPTEFPIPKSSLVGIKPEYK